jgi:hypothetical protein
VRRRIGYYAHHHGRGHVHRALAIAAHLRTPMTLLTSAEVPATGGRCAELDVRPLPLDVPTTSGERAAADRVPLPSVLHHAPIGTVGLRQRVARLTAWLEEDDPALLVVDVSVEVTLLARLAGVAPVVVRQHGDRTDPAHRAAYGAAAAFLAPWPAWFEDDEVERDVRDRTRYVGGFSRLGGDELARRAACDRAGLDPDERHVVVLWGAGGTDVTVHDVARAASATPGWRWTVVGPTVAGPMAVGPTVDPAVRDGPPGLDVRGWVDDPWALLRAADVVVSHAGHNAVSDAAAAGARLVVVPAARPFWEQHHKARRLHETGAAVVEPRWPDARSWPRVLDRASGLDTSVLRGFVDGQGAARAAAALDDLTAELAS